MRILCSTFGSAGDVFPMLGLALELRQRGHDVRFATNDHFRRVVTSHNLPFEPLGTESDYQNCISSPDLWHPRRAFGHVFHCLSPILKRQYELHQEHLAAPPPAAPGEILAITNCFGFGALLAQEKLGLPVITLHCQPAVLWSDRNPPVLPGLAGPRWLRNLAYRLGERFVIDATVCPFLNAWRRELGLAPVRCITRWWNSPVGVLCLFPDWYAPPQPDWPGALIQTDFPLWNAETSDGIPADVAAFLDAGDPPIVFTPGSANQHASGFFTASIEVCSVLNRRGILLSQFRGQLPAALPPSVAHFRYVPLDLLLPRAAAFVHHGGIGSTSQALLAGLPQVVTPLAHDQFDNAARVERLQVGASIPARRFSAPRLAEVITRLLSSAPVAAACRNAAAKLACRDGLQRSADAVELWSRTLSATARCSHQ